MPIKQFWTFYSYLDRGECVIHEWMTDKRIKPKAIAKIETIFNHLLYEKTWEPTYAKKLQGYPNIIEIRVTYQGMQYRPLGCYGPFKESFTLLIGAIEKDWKFEPKTAPEIADQRYKAINNNWSLIHEYETYIPSTKRSDEKQGT